MNQTIKTMYDRHSVRTFSDQPIAQSDIETILHAANQAPSAHNQQAWRFVVITGEKKQALLELISAQSGSFPRPSCALLRMAARSIASAPLVIAVINTGDLIHHGSELFSVDQEHARDFFRTMEIQSSAAAVQNMLLAATSLGVASVWLGILYLIKDEVRELLGEPAGEFMAVVPMGYATRDTHGPKKKPLETIVRYMN